MKDLVYGLIGGLIGATVWAAVAYLTEYEIGWIAWGIGGLVGYAVARGNQEQVRSPTAAGTLAVVITALSIVAGKYAAVELMIPSDEELLAMFTEGFLEDEYVVSFIADDVAVQMEAAGQELSWPEGMGPGDGSGEVDYPATVWAEAERIWGELGDAGQESFREEKRAQARSNVEENLPEIRAMISRGGFLGSFTPMDVIFFGLGMITAFGLGSGKKSEEEVAAAYGQALKLSMLSVMLADGDVEDDEIATVAAIYQQVTGLSIDGEAIRAEAAVVQSGGADLMAALTELAPHVKEEGKEALLKASIAVAMADGTVSPEEQTLVHGIARSIGMSDEHLQKTLAQFASGA